MHGEAVKGAFAISKICWCCCNVYYNHIVVNCWFWLVLFPVEILQAVIRFNIKRKNGKNSKPQTQTATHQTMKSSHQPVMIVNPWCSWQHTHTKQNKTKTPVALQRKCMYSILFLLRKVHSLKLTESGPSKRKIVFQSSIFRCYVSFREGNYSYQF